MKHSHQWSRDKGQWNGCTDEAYKLGGDKKTAVARIRRTSRQEGQEANSLEIDARLTQCNFYDLHRVNQVVQHKIIVKKIQRQAKKKKKKKKKKRMEKEEECLLRLKKKEYNSRKKNGAQLPLTHKTSLPFIEVVLTRSPSDSQECG